MQLTIVAGYYECSHSDHWGHASIRVLKSDEPWWHSGRAPWAEINLALSERPQNRTEGLRFASRTLERQLQARDRWAMDDDDLVEMLG